MHVHKVYIGTEVHTPYHMDKKFGGKIFLQIAEIVAELLWWLSKF